MWVLTRLRAVIGIAIALLAHDRTRTVIAIFGVAIAVLSVTLLAGVGVGVIETGEEQFDRADRDLWVTGGPLQIQPGTVGGIENTVVDSHQLAAELDEHPDVSNAVPMSFQTVYISTDRDEFETIVGSGVPGVGGGTVSIEEGAGFSGADTHYADGSYDGEMTHEAIVDPGAAETYDLEVGDTIYVGGTINAAARNEFEIVGISPTFSSFLGEETVTLRLSELQTLTGTAAADRATLISVSLEEGADPESVAAELQADHPDYDVRTNQEQLVATLQQQAVVLASGTSLVVLAVIAGMTLTLNLLMSLVYQQREAFSMLTALGAPLSTPVGVAAVQAIVVGSIGGVVGVGLTIPAAEALNFIALEITGFEGIVRLSPEILYGGFAIAMVMGLFGGIASAWRIGRSINIESLRG